MMWGFHGVSINGGTLKSSISIGFSVIKTIIFGVAPFTEPFFALSGQRHAAAIARALASGELRSTNSSSVPLQMTTNATYLHNSTYI